MNEHAWKKEGLNNLVKQMQKTYEDGIGINHVEGLNLPFRDIIYDIMDDVFAILFPGYMGRKPLTEQGLGYFVGDLLNSIYLRLSDQVEKSLHYACKLGKCDECNCSDMAKKAVYHLVEKLPEIRNKLKEDVQAAFDGDPAAVSFDEIILSYPCMNAIGTYRVSHELFIMDVPLIPRIMTERAHARTGIDIHPGANIGRRFFIDHGTGVVIGETTEIGDNVKIYQGVTLGALSFPKDEEGKVIRGVKRHPTIENNVTIYAEATILGGKTIIGEGAVVGGNVWLTSSVPPGGKVTMSKPSYDLK
ncbi:MAG: hypothetical protein P9M03_08450 [Candidatus Theseobacter exili]|nr:hypothetical protein [Candidatus Theseobacter exili]